MTANPIYNHEAEQGALACILRNPAQFTRLADILQPGMFYHRPFQWAWEAFGKLNEKGLAIDSVTLGDQLERDGNLAEFCTNSGGLYGRMGIAGLRDVLTTGDGVQYAVVVQDYAAKRKLLQHLNCSASQCLNGRSAAEIVADLTTEIGRIQLYGGKATSYTNDMTSATEHALDVTLSASRGERALYTGLSDLDKLVHIQKKELVIIASRPGEGKTVFIHTTLINTARRGKKVMLFVLEGGHVVAVQRLLAQIGGLDASRIIKGQLTSEEWDTLKKAKKELCDLPITICDLPAITIGQIRTEARKSDIDLVEVDYLQLTEADKKQERRDLDVGIVTRGLEALACELDIPIIAAAQTSRQATARAEGRPTLADLRESGSIEADAATVIFVHHDPDKNVELIVAKHRNGATGSVYVYMDKKSLVFQDANVRTVSFEP